MVLQLNLEQLTALSEKVFVGKCTAVETRRDSAGRLVQSVTFRVEEMLKGKPEEEVIFRQIVPSEVGMFQDLPSYEVGEETVVFLSEPGKSGLTAPVALKQGKFDVRTLPSGEKRVMNGLENRGLFIGWQKSPQLKSMTLTKQEKTLLKKNGGEISYSDFTSLVRKIAAP